MRRCWALILLAAMASASLGAGRPAAAQEPDEPEAAAPRRQRFRITDSHIDQWLFGPGTSAESARPLGEARLRSRIGYIDQLCGLTATQRRKLDIAGRGDIKRFFDVVARLHDEVRSGPIDIDRLRGLTVEAQAHGRKFRGQLWDEESLFGKTLQTILDPEQAAMYRRSWSEERLKAHESSIDWVLGMVQRRVGLSRDQSFRLHVALLEETRPPRNSGPWDYFGIMYQASRIPERKLRPIFEPSEWRAIRKEFDEARGMEARLRDSGYLPDEPPDRETARNQPSRDRRDNAEAPRQRGAADDPPAAGGTQAT